MSIKNGFTLAEVMITLGVIGIMAALMIPAITNTAPSQNKVLFRKAYSTMEKVVSALSNDSTNYPTTNQTTADGTFKIFNNTTATTNGSTDKFCYFFADMLNTVGNTACPSSGVAGPTKFATTSDGIVWSMYISGTEFDVNPTAYNTKIIIDVNPSAKSTNCTADTNGASYGQTKCSVTSDCSKNPDTFIIGVRYDGKLQVGVSDACAASILANPMNNSK